MVLRDGFRSLERIWLVGYSLWCLSWATENGDGALVSQGCWHPSCSCRQSWACCAEPESLRGELGVPGGIFTLLFPYEAAHGKFHWYFGVSRPFLCSGESLHSWNGIAGTRKNGFLLSSSLCASLDNLQSSTLGFWKCVWLKELKLKASKELTNLLPFQFPAAWAVCSISGSCHGGYLVVTPVGSLLSDPWNLFASPLLPLILHRWTEAMFSSPGLSKDVRIIRRWELLVWKYRKKTWALNLKSSCLIAVIVSVLLCVVLHCLISHFGSCRCRGLEAFRPWTMGDICWDNSPK